MSLTYMMSIDADQAMDMRIALRMAYAFLRREAEACAREGWDDLAADYHKQADEAEGAFKAFKAAITRADSVYTTKVETAHS